MSKQNDIQQSFNIASILVFVQTGLTFFIMLIFFALAISESNVALVIMLLGLVLVSIQLAIGFFLRKISKSTIEVMRENKTMILVVGILLLLTASLLSIIASVLIFIGYANILRTE